ncbi:DUF2975 domain-containing protein [Heyndrickxia coagulans]|uniref:DUF2975 domain-containing protein n=1 Tax=Heyndrickxia coagulans TaxID=1398 RepID=UPI002E06B575|nr:DUF2975 domain-containing protein [Heyndrickxia coagulans]MED4943006.1 DUF2975 domain-containing protein [Heyndrickxia coagulans]MED4963836.1 DUF2975 domain-containing protein [Heyndrickxia coagulans]
MKRGSTLFLRLAVILIGIPILALCIFVVPEIGKLAARLVPDFAFMEFLVLLVMYGVALPFYFALYQAFILLGLIDKNTAFSANSVTALKKIKSCAAAIGLLYLAGSPLFYLMADRDDAPGILAICFFIIFASAVITVFAAVLERLLQEAIEIKNENDLTV